MKNVAKKMDSIGAVEYVILQRQFQLLKNVVKEMDLPGVLVPQLNVMLIILNHKTNNAVRKMACFGAMVPVLTHLTHKFVVNHMTMHGVKTDHLDKSVI